jgi:hypothetical protein
MVVSFSLSLSWRLHYRLPSVDPPVDLDADG